MKNRILLNIILLISVWFTPAPSFSQEKTDEVSRAVRKYMQQAERALDENDMATAEALYRQAIAKDPTNAEARYNLGNLYYENEIEEEAVTRHDQAGKVAEERSLKHNSYHNQGNAFMKQKKYQEAIEAYKNSLRNNPNDEETRYNLALAKELLEDERKGGGDEDKNQKNKDQQDQKQDQEEQDQDQEKDQGEGEQEKDDEGEPKEEGEGGDRENEDPKNDQDEKGKDDEGKPQDQEQDQQQGNESDTGEPKQPESRPGQLSPQQVKNLLEAMGNEEKKVQEKINAKKMKGAKTKNEKDW